MLDYTKLSNQELINRLDNLQLSESQDLAMDGSGELGHIIVAGYLPYYEAIYNEMDTRGMCDVAEYDDKDEMPY